MSSGETSTTPMMQQYRELKARDPDALLLFRMGDFYEMFGDDAERASQLLGLTLTSRDKGTNAMPMAGFPHFALEGYLVKLIQAGQRAAVCEQVEDPKQAKGLVRRDIVRVVTPGTLTDDALLDPKTANYLVAVVETKGKLALAWSELSTGRFFVSGLSRMEFADEIARLDPAEAIISETALEAPWVKILRARPHLPVTVRPSWDFQHDQAFQALRDHFQTHTMAGFGIDDQSTEIQAAGALVTYLRETQKTALGHLTRLTPHRRGETLGLDEMTRRSLELTRTLREGKREGSLLDVVDRTCTAMGARLLAEWLTSPLTLRDRIEARHGAVAELIEATSLREGIRDSLGQANDLERLAARIGTGRATPRDLVGLARTLAILPSIKARLTARKSPLLSELEASLELCPEIRASIEAAVVDDPPLAVKEGGMIRDGYHPHLDELRELAKGGKSWIARYQSDQVRRTNIPGLKVGFNKVFGYYIEVTHAQGAKVPADYIRKQTVKNAERYITPELKEYEDKVLRAEDRACELEYELFTSLRDRVSAEAPRLVQAGAVLAQLDTLAGLAELAAKQGFCRPEMVDEPILDVQAGRHPVLDCIMPVGQFVPNDVKLAPDDATLLLLTGPNMAGKSTYIRQVALMSVLAQAGSFVPARKATLGIVDRLFARVGATDELGRGQSTFMVEMTETANILHNATAHSLVILDEIGRGTSTFDGVSLAWAIAEHIHDVVGCRCLFATHYHELVELEKIKARFRNANVAVREQEGEIVFLHRIVPGGADQSYGIHVARLAGVPSTILERAREVLAFLEKQHAGDAGGTQAAAQTKPAGLPRARSARSLQGSLFAGLPDPMVEALRQVDASAIDLDAAQDLIRRLKELAG